jgi:hypothetical protein
LLNPTTVYVGFVATQPAWITAAEYGHNSGVPDDQKQPREPFDDETLAAFEKLRQRAKVAVERAREARDRTTAAQRVHALIKELESAAHELDGLRAAMRTRATIEQAKGVLMCLHGCSADEAFQRLVRLSQTSQRKLHDVASKIIEDVASGREGISAVVDLTSREARNC